MPLIFVNTDNSNPKAKIFVATSAGRYAASAEAKMEAVVDKIIEKTPGFTTTGDEKSQGYTIRLKVAKVTIANQSTRCEISGELVRFPETASKSGEKGAQMVSTGFTGGGTATGTNESSLLDCVEAVTEGMVAKAIPAMRTDMTNR